MSCVSWCFSCGRVRLFSVFYLWVGGFVMILFVGGHGLFYFLHFRSYFPVIFLCLLVFFVCMVLICVVFCRWFYFFSADFFCFMWALLYFVLVLVCVSYYFHFLSSGGGAVNFLFYFVGGWVCFSSFSGYVGAWCILLYGWVFCVSRVSFFLSGVGAVNFCFYVGGVVVLGVYSLFSVVLSLYPYCNCLGGPE